MFGISEKTLITGVEVTRGTIAQAISDKNLHRNVRFDYFGRRALRGTVEVLIRGEWKTLRFYSLNGWAQTLEVL